MQYSPEQWLSCCLLNGGLFPETLRAVLAYAMYYLFYNEFMIPDETR